MSVIDITNGLTTTIATGDVLHCDYSGSAVSISLPKGTYLLECWGAQGGDSTDTVLGGKGGYSKGTLTLTAKTTAHIYVGQAGIVASAQNADNAAIAMTSTNAFNGGGYGVATSRASESGYAVIGSGGGATDIRVGTDSIYARLIVAGGGGGSAWLNYWQESGMGGYGGGTAGGSGTVGSSNFTSYVAPGGTQTAGGAGSYAYGTNNVEISNGLTVSGTFYNGADMSLTVASGYEQACGGGGGGWYGGAAGCKNAGGGGGGSGYVYTSSTAANYPSGCLLNSAYYLADAETTTGDQSFAQPDGTTATGRSGNGYAVITCVSVEDQTIYIKEGGAWKQCLSAYRKVGGAWASTPISTFPTILTSTAIDETRHVWEKLEGADDPHTKLLLNFENGIIDESGNSTVTNHGVELATDCKMGEYSGFFSTNKYISIPASELPDLNGNWTIDWWDYWLSNPSTSFGCIYNQTDGTVGTSPTKDRGILIGYTGGSNSIQFYAAGVSATWDIAAGVYMGDVVLNQWHHHAVVKNGNTYTTYSDGIQIRTVTSSLPIMNTHIGCIGRYAGDYGYFNGRIDEFRFSNTARWTANFTPPSTAYPTKTHAGYVTSTDPDAFPANGAASDGFYYKKI